MVDMKRVAFATVSAGILAAAPTETDAVKIQFRSAGAGELVRRVEGDELGHFGPQSAWWQPLDRNAMIVEAARADEDAEHELPDGDAEQEERVEQEFFEAFRARDGEPADVVFYWIFKNVLDIAREQATGSRYSDHAMRDTLITPRKNAVIFKLRGGVPLLRLTVTLLGEIRRGDAQLQITTVQGFLQGMHGEPVQTAMQDGRGFYVPGVFLPAGFEKVLDSVTVITFRFSSGQSDISGQSNVDLDTQMSFFIAHSRDGDGRKGNWRLSSISVTFGQKIISEDKLGRWISEEVGDEYFSEMIRNYVDKPTPDLVLRLARRNGGLSAAAEQCQRVIRQQQNNVSLGVERRRRGRGWDDDVQQCGSEKVRRAAELVLVGLETSGLETRGLETKRAEAEAVKKWAEDQSEEADKKSRAASADWLRRGREGTITLRERGLR